MPELPEVETIVRGLRRHLSGQVITGVDILWERTVAAPDSRQFAERLIGQTVHAIDRRGKYILFRLTRDTLIAHLRMTGKFLFFAHGDPITASDHARVKITFASGDQLVFQDVRKFGRLYLVAEPAHILSRLGPEPLDDLDLGRFQRLLRSHRRQIKPLLLDQHILAGVGNIYTDEILWAARIHPLRRSDKLSDREIACLFKAMQSILQQAITAGGTTIRDYADSEQRPGRFLSQLAVYGRSGEPCPRCGTPIQRMRVGGRGTHICPQCQPYNP